MKKTSLITAIFLVLCLSLTLINSCKTYKNKNGYLQKVLNNLENINSVTYNSTISASAPGDTLEFVTFSRYSEEYVNKADTTIGSSFTVTQQDSTHKTSWFYDGTAFTYLLWDEKKIEIDSFLTNNLPVRPVATPFFNYTKSILRYSLETKDTISTDLKDFGDSIKFSLFIPHKVIEFHGKPVIYYNPYLSRKDEYSRYDIWIKKSNSLPFRYVRHMPHQTSWEKCKNAEFNKKNNKDFIVSEYFPKDFPISVRGKQQSVNIDLTGKIANDWSLKDVNNNTVSLKDLKSKVILIQFSGIGCGPCHASIPFLKKLVGEYKNMDFELISIETWSKNIDGIKRYQKNNDLNYRFLLSTEDLTKSYNVKLVPVFYILDKDRVIRKIIEGYSENTTDKEIRDAINKLI
jgi:thiol-disulfide isomerase/thioredoxin